jgi:hypothetical protein
MKRYLLERRTIDGIQVALKEITGALSLLVRGIYYISFNFLKKHHIIRCGKR